MIKVHYTVDGILSVFTKLVEKLDKVIENEQKRADDAAVRAAILKKEEEEHLSEVARAKKVKANITKLIH